MSAKVAIYVRESTMRQVQKGYNLEEQKRILTARVNRDYKDGCEIIMMEERGESAKDLNRTKMKQLLDMVKREEIDAVYIIAIDRLSRSIIDMASLVQMFQEHDVDLISYQENIDLKTPQGRMQVNMLTVIAQWEREIISARVGRALLEGARQGKYVKSLPPFGYQKDPNERGKLILKEPEASFMKETFRRLDEEEITISELTVEYNSKKYFNRNWKHLYKMIRNPVYHGEVEIRGVAFKNLIPALISEKQQERIIAKIHTTKVFKKHQYLYRNVCYCGCGAKMKTTCTVSNKKTKKVFIYYYCVECNSKYYNELKITNALLKEINEYGNRIIKDELMDQATSKANQVFKKLNQLDVVHSKNAVDEKYYQDEHDRLMNELKDISGKLINDKRIGNFRFEKMEYKEQRSFILKNVEKIKISKTVNSAKIYWKDKDE
ncbi:MAG: recombinase family protein [Solobacterium sp.]|nr:recombinase family protein [Solobacterium sp.]